MKASAVFLFLLFAFTGILVSASTFVTDHVAHVDALHLQEQITQVIELLQEQNLGSARIIELLLEEHEALSARALLKVTDDGGRDETRPATHEQDWALALARIANATEATAQNTKVAVGLAWWGASWAMVGGSATVTILVTNLVWHYAEKKKMSKGMSILYNSEDNR